MQPVLQYLIQNREGIARHVVDDALRSTGYKGHPEAEAVILLRGRIASYIYAGLAAGNLEEPNAPPPAPQDTPAEAPSVPQAASEEDKATPMVDDGKQAPQATPDASAEAPAEAAPEPARIPGEEVLETRQPPRRRRPPS